MDGIVDSRPRISTSPFAIRAPKRLVAVASRTISEIRSWKSSKTDQHVLPNMIVADAAVLVSIKRSQVTEEFSPRMDE